MFAKIKKTISIYNMLSKWDRILVGLSGGADSVCLLYVLKEIAPEFKLKLYAAHLNHSLRGKESDGDEEFCKELCKNLGIPIFTKKIKIVKAGGSLEDSARKARYSFFEETAKKVGADKFALAHSADDQAETVLMRLLRGAGAKGLSGIPSKRVLGSVKTGKKMGCVPILVRPLIDVWKEEILDFLKKRKIDYREDSSNKKLDFFRNRVRHELIPFLEKYNPNVKNVLLATGRNMAMTNEFISGIVEKEFDKNTDLKISRLKNLPQIVCREVIRKAAKNFEPDLVLTAGQIDDVLSLITSSAGSKELNLSHGIKIVREYSKLVFVETTKKKLQFEYELQVPGRHKIHEHNILVTSMLCKNTGHKIRKPFEVMMDYDKILRPIVLRNRRQGDVFLPIGFNGTKKVKNIFIDEKIPERIRDRVLLFVSGKEICWIPGYRVGERFKVGPNTKKVLTIKIEGVNDLWQTQVQE